LCSDSRVQAFKRYPIQIFSQPPVDGLVIEESLYSFIGHYMAAIH